MKIRLSTGALLAAASAVSYGSLAIFAKLAYGEGWNVPSLLAVRFGIGALFVLPFALRGSSWKGGAGAFGLGAIGYVATTAFYFPSLHHLPAAVASFLLFLAPAFIAVLSRIFFKERMGWRGTLALGLAMTGLALIAVGAFVGRLPAVGVLLAVGSAVAYSLTVLFSRIVVVVHGLHWARASLLACAGAFTAYALFAFGTGAAVVPPGSAALLWALGIGTLATGVALSLFFAAILRIGPSKTALVSTLEPASTLAFAAMFLGEVPAWTSLVGGAFILAAAALVALEAPLEDKLPTAGP